MANIHFNQLTFTSPITSPTPCTIFIRHVSNPTFITVGQTVAYPTSNQYVGNCSPVLRYTVSGGQPYYIGSSIDVNLPTVDYNRVITVPLLLGIQQMPALPPNEVPPVQSLLVNNSINNEYENLNSDPELNSNFISPFSEYGAVMVNGSGFIGYHSDSSVKGNLTPESTEFTIAFKVFPYMSMNEDIMTIGGYTFRLEDEKLIFVRTDDPSTIIYDGILIMGAWNYVILKTDDISLVSSLKIVLNGEESEIDSTGSMNTSLLLGDIKLFNNSNLIKDLLFSELYTSNNIILSQMTSPDIELVSIDNSYTITEYYLLDNIYQFDIPTFVESGNYEILIEGILIDTVNVNSINDLNYYSEQLLNTIDDFYSINNNGLVSYIDDTEALQGIGLQVNGLLSDNSNIISGIITKGIIPDSLLSIKIDCDNMIMNDFIVKIGVENVFEIVLENNELKLSVGASIYIEDFEMIESFTMEIDIKDASLKITALDLDKTFVIPSGMDRGSLYISAESNSNSDFINKVFNISEVDISNVDPTINDIRIIKERYKFI